MLPGTVRMTPVSHVVSEFHLELLPLQILDIMSQASSLPQEMLASLSIIHRVLACRYFLMAHDKVLKLADIGLEREVEDVCL